MEKIKLGSGTELELIVCGIQSYEKKVSFDFLRNEYTLSQVETLLSNTSETSKLILLSEAGEELQIFSGYTQLDGLSLKKDYVISTSEESTITADVISVVLVKPDETITRIESLESQVTDTQMALCELYEMIG